MELPSGSQGDQRAEHDGCLKRRPRATKIRRNRAANSFIEIGPIAIGAAVAIALAGLAGCGQKQVEITKFDAAMVTQLAMEQLDADKNGELDNNELENCPGLIKSRKQIDGDENGTISAAELQQRMQDYIDQQVAILPYPLVVTWRGRPLAGAKIELIPEPFMADVIEPASGETDERGVSRPSIELDPEIAERGTFGYRSGVYRVKLSKQDASGKELLPEKFNVKSTVGIEVKVGGHMEPIYLRL
ncbi:hypothetical protein OAS39_12605 [Pirellulales bacterium]|nr:hypothetical protein [Pirellulales bacterium]